MRAANAAREAPPSRSASEIEALAEEDAKVVLRMYGINRRAIDHAARDAGIAPHFFWQPIPEHAYSEKYRIFPNIFGPRAVAVMRALYRLFPGKEGAVVDLSGMLASYDRPAYVDAHHYAPAVCKMIAERIAQAM
jgi:hypothetical protein